MWKLSGNFEKKWLENIGPPLPTPDEIDQMINESIIVQKQMDLFTSRGLFYRVLGMYWHPEREIVFKVDHKKRKVVMLITGGQMDLPGSQNFISI